MNSWRLEIVVAVTGLALAVVMIGRWHRAMATPPTAPAVTPTPTLVARVLDANVLEDRADAAIERNPFRISRRVSDVPFTSRAAGPPPPNAPAFRGPLTVRGIVGGPPWQAIMDGLPGQPPGTMVRTGTTFDKLSIRAVTRDSVIVQGQDTVWRLALIKGGV